MRIEEHRNSNDRAIVIQQTAFEAKACSLLFASVTQVGNDPSIQKGQTIELVAELLLAIPQ